MTEKELWEQFVAANPSYRNATYEAWCYGSDDPDALLALTLAGTKTATASAYPAYVYENCDPPAVGALSILLNTRQEAKGIIRTTRVTIVPFRDVPEKQAYLEGEGDRSLSFWRSVHAQVFAAEMAEIGTQFTEDMLVVCEEFELLYPKKSL